MSSFDPESPFESGAGQPNPFDLPPTSNPQPAHANPYAVPSAEAFQPQPWAAPVEPESNPVGTAGCALSGLSILLHFVWLAVIISFTAQNAGNRGGPIAPDGGVIAVTMGAMCGAGLFCLAGGVCSLIGLLLPNRRRGFAITGLFVGGLQILGFLFLMIVGMLANA